MVGGERRAPQLLLQLRAARLLPGHRARVPDQPPLVVGGALLDAAAGGPGGGGPALPGDDPAAGERRHLLHRDAGGRAAGVAGAAGDLPARRGHPGRSGRAGRTLLRGAVALDGVPLRPAGLPAGHRGLHRAVLPAGAVGGVGRGRLAGVRRAGHRASPARGVRRQRGGRRRRPAERDPGRGRQLVAVLQGRDAPLGVRTGRALHLGQRGPAPDHGQGLLEVGERSRAVRHAVPAAPEGHPRPRAGRRRRVRIRRRHRAQQGRPSRRRRGDRPAHPAAGPAAQPRPCLPGPPRHHPRQRRPGLPPGHPPEVRPDPVRAARLPGPGQRGVADPAGELPVHPAGAGVGALPPDGRRRVRDVQLLPRELADRPAGRHREHGLRAHAVRGQLHPAPGGGLGGPAARRTSSAPRRTVRRPRWSRPRPTTRPSSTSRAG